MIKSLPNPSLVHLEGAKPASALTDERLFDACGVRIAFMGRAGGVSAAPYASLNTGGHVGDDPASVMRNRAIVARVLGCEAAPMVVPKQVHGTHIVRVADGADIPKAQEEALEGADAVLVEAPGVTALLNFADCLPLIVVAPSGRFAVVHAGWRGALAGISGKVVRALCEAEGHAGSGPSMFNAYIGPHIRTECFEVDEDVAAQFAQGYGEDVVVGGNHVDLSLVVSTDLVRAGMDAERIADARLCTVCNTQEYFSYRAEGVCGRHAVAALRLEGQDGVCALS